MNLHELLAVVIALVAGAARASSMIWSVTRCSCLRASAHRAEGSENRLSAPRRPEIAHARSGSRRYCDDHHRVDALLDRLGVEGELGAAGRCSTSSWNGSDRRRCADARANWCATCSLRASERCLTSGLSVGKRTRYAAPKRDSGRRSRAFDYQVQTAPDVRRKQREDVCAEGCTCSETGRPEGNRMPWEQIKQARSRQQDPLLSRTAPSAFRRARGGRARSEVLDLATADTDTPLTAAVGL